VIPYLILGGAYLFFINILAGKDVVEFFKDLGWITYYKDGVATYWYINFILIMYLIYPLIYRLLEGRYRNLSLAGMLALAFLLIYLVYSYNFTLYDNIEQSLTRIPIFIIGCYWGRLVKDKRPIREFWIIYALVIPWLGGILQYIGYRDIFPWTVSRRIWYGMMAISICILFSLLLSIAELKYIKKFLNFAGTLSLELYLSHIAMKGVLKRIFPDWAKWSMTKSCFRYFVGVVVAAFLISVVYHFLSDRIGRKIKYRK
jgi:peptidoglycan/LPS O-acetylase OafA/YrhL